MKKIKIFLIAFAFLIIPIFGFGESVVGNGGGAWVCQNNDTNQTIRWATLVDLYEGREEYKLNIPVESQGKDYKEVLESKKIRLQLSAPDFSEALFPTIHSKVLLLLAYIRGQIFLITQSAASTF